MFLNALQAPTRKILSALNAPQPARPAQTTQFASPAQMDNCSKDQSVKPLAKMATSTIAVSAKSATQLAPNATDQIKKTAVPALMDSH